MLHRHGSKAAIAKEIEKLFPAHTVYIEPFFGAGGMFFNKRKAQYNLLNDADEEVFNLFIVLQNPEKAAYFKDYYNDIPLHNALFEHWKKNIPENDVKRAVRFVFLTNHSLMSKGASLRIETENTRANFIANISFLQKKLQDCIFDNSEFEEFFAKIKDRVKEQRAFVYCDPPYLGTTGYKGSKKWKISDFERLVEILLKNNWNFGISEFDNPLILECAKDNGLNITFLGERKNIKNRRQEIYINNYPISRELF